jgi:hypothetical protein
MPGSSAASRRATPPASLGLAGHARVAGEAVVRRVAAVVEQAGDQRRRVAIRWRARQLADAAWLEHGAVDAHAGREGRGDDLRVAGQPATDEQFLHAVAGAAELPVVAVEVGAIARVYADDDQAVHDVAIDAQARQRAGAEAIGGTAAAAEGGVAAEIGTDTQGHSPQAAGDLQKLQCGRSQLAGRVALDDERGQRSADVGAPVGARALRADVVGTAADRPKTSDGATDLRIAEDVAAGAAARQLQIAERVCR